MILRERTGFPLVFKLTVFAVIAAIGAIAYVAVQQQFNARSSVIVMETGASDVTAHLIWPNPPAAPGLAHYTEHLAWANAVGARARNYKNHSNAWTSGYAIGYLLSGSPDELEDVLQRLVDTAKPLALDPSFAREERDVVMREYDLRIVGNIDAQVDERTDAFLYDGNQLAQSVIGSPDDINAMTYEAAQRFHAQSHRLDAATLVVVGDVSRRQVRRALRAIGHSKDSFGMPGAATVSFTLGPTATEYFRFPKEDATPRLQFRRVVRLDEPIDFDVLEAHIALLRDILESNVPGGFAGPLRFDAAFARSFRISMWALDEQHVELYLTATPDRGVTLAELSDEIDRVLQTTATDGIPNRSYRRIKDRFGGFWPNWNDPDEVDDWIAEYAIDRVSVLRRPMPKASVQMVQSELSFNVVNGLMEAFASEGRTSVAFIGPERTFE